MRPHRIRSVRLERVAARKQRLRSHCQWALALSLLLISASRPALAIQWLEVGNRENSCDARLAHCPGSVDYTYEISRFETTSSEYAEFLNAVASSDPHGLYHPSMGTDPLGSILRSGEDGAFSYSLRPGRENMPANFVSFYDAIRFANWTNNGRGSSDTETGSYTISREDLTGISVLRNPDSHVFLPNEDEWYKAAYHQGLTDEWIDYPAPAGVTLACSADPDAGGANCGNALTGPSPVGNYSATIGPYGTLDQGGNLSELTETLSDGFGFRLQLGGAFGSTANDLSFAGGSAVSPSLELDRTGFRLVRAVPEPSTGLLLLYGLLIGWGTTRRNRGTPRSPGDEAFR